MAAPREDIARPGSVTPRAVLRADSAIASPDPVDREERERPLVSVITIFFNGERFLEEAIQSVLAQTYDRWELLLVDDGSTDRSAVIAAQYAQQYPSRIRLLRHPGGVNRGMSASRNLAISAAAGELISFVDADDVYLPEKLERQVALMARFPEAGMIYGATLYWYSWSGRPEDEPRDRIRRRRLPEGTLIYPPKLFTAFMSNRARTPCTCGVVLRRAAVQAVGGFEEEFRGLYEDQVFFCKLALSTPTYIDSGCWDRYRQHPDSCVNQARETGDFTARGRPTADRLRFLEWAAAYLALRGIEDRPAWRAVRRQTRAAHYPRLAEYAGRLRDSWRRVVTRAAARSQDMSPPNDSRRGA